MRRCRSKSTARRTTDQSGDDGRQNASDLGHGGAQGDGDAPDGRVEQLRRHHDDGDVLHGAAELSQQRENDNQSRLVCKNNVPHYFMKTEFTLAGLKLFNLKLSSSKNRSW